MIRTQWFCCTTPPINLGAYEYRMKPVESATRIYVGDYKGHGNWYGRGAVGPYGILLGLTWEKYRDRYEWRGLASDPKAKP
jgi:hypothetical protein